MAGRRHDCYVIAQQVDLALKSRSYVVGFPTVRTSATTGEGIPESRDGILRHRRRRRQAFRPKPPPPPQLRILTNLRTQRTESENHSPRSPPSQAAITKKVPHEMLPDSILTMPSASAWMISQAPRVPDYPCVTGQSGPTLSIDY